MTPFEVAHELGQYTVDSATRLQRAVGQRPHRPVPTSPVDDPDASAPAQSKADLSELAERVSEAEGSRVLLVPEDGAFRVLSYE